MQTSDKYLTCVRALKTFVYDAGFSDVVIGLSGGIDSALAAVMCTGALGAKHVHGVLLPGPYSSEDSVVEAHELACNLAIKTCTVSINEPFSAFEKALADACNNKFEGLTAENVQARCRMVCLMALSNAHGWMLINTGNKSEALMGYSTLYGDMAGAFAPLGGLYKTEVYELARWCNVQALSRGEVPPIPKHTLTKPPSAELAPGQEDEKSMGIAYVLLDKLLFALVEQKQSVPQLIAAGFDPRDVERVCAAVKAGAFKRSYLPPHPRMA